MPISAISLEACRLAQGISAAHPKLCNADLGYFARNLSFGRGDLGPPTRSFAAPICASSQEFVGWKKRSLPTHLRPCSANLSQVARSLSLGRRDSCPPTRGFAAPISAISFGACLVAWGDLGPPARGF